MSDESTPETSKAVRESNGQRSFVLKETCQRLERERDKAMDDLADETKFHNRTHSELVKVQCQLIDITKERDEANTKIQELKDLNKAHSKNRAEQADELLKLTFENRRLEQERNSIFNKLNISISERNDALNQIQGWENKWKSAIEIAAIAENACDTLKRKLEDKESQLDEAMSVILKLEQKLT